jgi:hypothetical protein
MEIISDPVLLKVVDVNNTATINALDAAKIKGKVVGFINSFARGNWFFELQSGGNLLPVNTLNPTFNIFGICVGDVNKSYQPLK